MHGLPLPTQIPKPCDAVHISGLALGVVLPCLKSHERDGAANATQHPSRVSGCIPAQFDRFSQTTNNHPCRVGRADAPLPSTRHTQQWRLIGLLYQRRKGLHSSDRKEVGASSSIPSISKMGCAAAHPPTVQAYAGRKGKEGTLRHIVSANGDFPQQKEVVFLNTSFH